MLKLAPATEQFQHFVSNLRESFWGDLNGRTREAWKKFFEADSERQRDRFAVVDAYERNGEQRRAYRNGYYERDFVTVLGTLRLRIARTREQSFLPAGIEEFQRRAPEVSMLIREAFLRGISTRQVGRVVAIVTGQTVSAQTVSKLTRDLDEAVQQYPTMVKQLEKDLPHLLAFFSFPKHLWKQLRTTNIIERCFVEVRRRTRPMVCFVNVKSVDRIIYSILSLQC